MSGSTPHRGTTFRRAYSAVERNIGKAAGKHGFAEKDVLLRWREVVGEALANVCRPVNVSYGARKSGLGATLTIAAEGAHAPEIAHETSRIIERVNRFYGYAAVSRIRLTQTATGFAEPAASFRPAPEPADRRVAEGNAEAMASGIENDEFRAALVALGASILTRRKPAAD